MPESDNERPSKLIVSENEASGRCVRSEPQNIKSNFSPKSISLTLTRDNRQLTLNASRQKSK